MNQGQVVSVNDMLCVLLRTCDQYLESNKELEARITYDNVINLAMVFGSSDEVVRFIFRIAFQLSGAHPELQYFGLRATHEELARLKKHQDGHLETKSAIDKASRGDLDTKGTPPLLR